MASIEEIADDIRTLGCRHLGKTYDRQWLIESLQIAHAAGRFDPARLPVDDGARYDHVINAAMVISTPGRATHTPA
jgi:hypothetical protein